jgi:hypothetical protein
MIAPMGNKKAKVKPIIVPWAITALCRTGSSSCALARAATKAYQYGSRRGAFDRNVPSHRPINNAMDFIVVDE